MNEDNAAKVAVQHRPLMDAYVKKLQILVRRYIMCSRVAVTIFSSHCVVAFFYEDEAPRVEVLTLEEKEDLYGILWMMWEMGLKTGKLKVTTLEENLKQL